MKRYRLLFLCSGNTCRSPLAEAIAEDAARTAGLALDVSSAGTGAVDGQPASDGALLIALEQGLDLSLHRARLLSRDIVTESDLILVMSQQHRERVVALGGGGKVHLLTAYAASSDRGEPVADPFGGDLDGYREAFAELSELVGRALARIRTERTSRPK